MTHTSMLAMLSKLSLVNVLKAICSKEKVLKSRLLSKGDTIWTLWAGRDAFWLFSKYTVYLRVVDDETKWASPMPIVPITSFCKYKINRMKQQMHGKCNYSHHTPLWVKSCLTLFWLRGKLSLSLFLSNYFVHRVVQGFLCSTISTIQHSILSWLWMTLSLSKRENILLSVVVKILHCVFFCLLLISTYIFCSTCFHVHHYLN